MSEFNGQCEICGTPMVIHYCCSGRECGCMGMPIEPPACSDECFDKLMDKYAKIREDHKKRSTPYKLNT